MTWSIWKVVRSEDMYAVEANQAGDIIGLGWTRHLPLTTGVGGGEGGYQVIALDSESGDAYDIRVHATFAEVVGALDPNSELPLRTRYWRLDSTGP